MGKIKLTEAQQELVEKNINLVYFYAEKFVGTVPVEKDEIHSVMMLGICKAAVTFNPEKSKFSTYATRCMRNELFMRLRQENKWNRQAYISDIAARTDRQGENVDSGDQEDFILIDKSAPPLEDAAIIKVIVEQLTVWLNEQEAYMNPTTKKIIRAWLDNPEWTQAELAKETKVSQAQVSRILKRVKNQVISTFFRGNKDWLHDEQGRESELSREFMELSKERPVTPERTNGKPVDIDIQIDVIPGGQLIFSELEPSKEVHNSKRQHIRKKLTHNEADTSTQMSLFDEL